MRAGILACSIAAVVTAGVTQNALADPAQNYVLYCMGCHGAQAEGVPGKIPPLANSLGRFMRSAAGRDYLLRVPGAANSALSDNQLADVLNWLAQRFSPHDLPSDVVWFTAEEVAHARRAPLANVQATRREVVKSLGATGPAPPAEY